MDTCGPGRQVGGVYRVYPIEIELTRASAGGTAVTDVTVAIGTTGFFEILGVQPVCGRDFTMDEERPVRTWEFSEIWECSE